MCSCPYCTCSPGVWALGLRQGRQQSRVSIITYHPHGLQVLKLPALQMAPTASQCSSRRLSSRSPSLHPLKAPPAPPHTAALPLKVFHPQSLAQPVWWPHCKPVCIPATSPSSLEGVSATSQPHVKPDCMAVMAHSSRMALREKLQQLPRRRTVLAPRGNRAPAVISPCRQLDMAALKLQHASRAWERAPPCTSAPEHAEQAAGSFHKASQQGACLASWVPSQSGTASSQASQVCQACSLLQPRPSLYLQPSSSYLQCKRLILAAAHVRRLLPRGLGMALQACRQGSLQTCRSFLQLP